jgi:hypothetical protein
MLFVRSTEQRGYGGKNVMKKTRQFHLWIGLICSVFILIEAVTGLLMMEPWLLGEAKGPQRGEFNQQIRQQQSANPTNGSGAVDGISAPANGNFGPRREGGTGISGFIRNLHQGRIGGTDVGWVIDLAAIGMIVLTATGIVLSTKTLAAQSAQRRRKRTLELHQ